MGEAVDVGVAQPPQQGEESQVDGLVGLAAVETVDAVGVRGSDRPDVGDGAVAQDDVGLHSLG